jgi:hypothetical protein
LKAKQYSASSAKKAKQNSAMLNEKDTSVVLKLPTRSDPLLINCLVNEFKQLIVVSKKYPAVTTKPFALLIRQEINFIQSPKKYALLVKESLPKVKDNSGYYTLRRFNKIFNKKFLDQ